MKKILLSLFVGFVGIISFGYCEEVVGLADIYSISNTSYNGQNGTPVPIIDFGNVGQKIVCISLFPTTDNVQIAFAENVSDLYDPYRIWRNWDGKYSCLVKGANTPYLTIRGGYNSAGTVYGTYFYLDELLETEIPVLTSLECQERYSLIPIENIDSNYCEINGLCPVCPELTGFGFSSFYVKKGDGDWNELSGTDNYFVYIPDYLGYNYDYSNQGRDLDFTVGVSVDTGYLSEVIDVQNYQPTSDDFSKLVGLFGSYGGLLIACLFVIIVFYLIKKMFK